MPWNNNEQTRQAVTFDLHRLLEGVAGFKGKEFPAALAGIQKGAVSELADNGTALRKKDLLGGYYFMPVVFSAEGESHEIDCALVSLRLCKNVVQTPLSGQGGTVKELTGVEDIHISVTGCLLGGQGQWPEERVNGLRRLFEVNDSVSLKCALTDCFFEADDKVVITSLRFPEGGQVEDTVPVSIECVQDNVFELKID
ncbi:MAG: DUF6046 domain-containing protein [Bacteroides sp.]|nr:DUF6046 domain-containing protein [Bacteroides sp.]MCM1086304.1 DUF6046 domain-containing protein [Bacteroides sp.]